MFTHLHLHTEYSLLDGVSKVQNLNQKLQDLGMTACAITDHGNMYGSFKFYSAMKDAGLKPIIGCEIYVSPRSMYEKEHGIDNKYYHLVLLAQNLQGYKNLLKIVSIGHMEGFYYKPRVDFQVLEKYSEGLIVLSACLAGVVARELMNGNRKKAEEHAKKYSELYKDRFFIEIQRNGIKEQDEINPQLLEIAKKFNLPIVATCDTHYINKGEHEIQEVLWCIADGKTIEDPTRRKYGSQEFYVKSSEEMEALFSDLPEAIENTQKIVDMVEEYSLSFGRVEPTFMDLPEGKTSAEYLRDLTYEGAKAKYSEITEELRARIDYELSVIDDKGYNDYFLVTRDFVKFCHQKGIVVGMRGSGCGSVVAYCTEITHLEPIGWELYFERFLNPERKSPPDFDLDIADERRDEVLEYVSEKYGRESVKQIATFSKLQTRQAIRDVSRVLGLDLQTADRLSKMVEIVFGKSKDIDYMIEHNNEFATIIKSSPDLLKMAEIVRKLNGLCRGISTHACGVVITPGPVDDYVPIQRDAHGGGMGMTQFEMTDLEYVGLMKFDFLGLRNLNIIGKALHKIEKSGGENIDLINIDPKDQKAFELIKSGHTVGIFQMEGEGMKKTVRQIKPETLEDICYVLAAYRPGPMQYIPEYADVKFGRKSPEYLMPELENILSVTNGIITYQEQVIRIAVDIAGYSMGGADMLRRAIGKKKMDIMEQEKAKFLEGASQKGFDRDAVEKLWDKVLQFANYGFNKAHSASYALVSYWTAYLKSHYPLEFMASMLEADLDFFDRIVIDLEECERLGIKVLPPDVNMSDHLFKVEDIEKKNIRFGLAGIKNVGEDLVKTIVEERNENGPYLNFDDFVYRSIPHNISSKAVQYLIMAGAFDSFGERNALIELCPRLFERYKKERISENQGQIDIFAIATEVHEVKKHIEIATEIPQVEKASLTQMLDWEKELLGLYVSSHPLDHLVSFFESKGCVSIKDLDSASPDSIVLIGAIVSNIKRITTKKNQNMAFLRLEDKSGMIDAVLFPAKYEELKNDLAPNRPMLFAGRINMKDGQRSLVVEKAKAVDEKLHSEGINSDAVIFKIRQEDKIDEIELLKKTIKDNPGDTSVKLIINTIEGDREMRIEHKVAINDDIKKMIERFAS